MATVAEEGQRYPYFVQLWGEALWDQLLATGATRLTAAHVDAARPEVGARVADYYQDRYRELETRGLVPAAIATAPLFQTGAGATTSDQAIDAAERLAAREGLNRLGYFWSPPGQLQPVVWVAGIPSLMTCVLDRTR